LKPIVPASHVIEVNSSHAIPITFPDVVVDVIEQAARAVNAAYLDRKSYEYHRCPVHRPTLSLETRRGFERKPSHCIAEIPFCRQEL
jgi:hypothetical protein